MSNLRIGTSGWNCRRERDLERHFYPPKAAARGLEERPQEGRRPAPVRRTGLLRRAFRHGRDQHNVLRTAQGSGRAPVGQNTPAGFEFSLKLCGSSRTSARQPWTRARLTPFEGESSRWRTPARSVRCSRSFRQLQAIIGIQDYLDALLEHFTTPTCGGAAAQDLERSLRRNDRSAEFQAPLAQIDGRSSRCRSGRTSSPT